MNMYANISIIASSTINGRTINEYELETSIGTFYVVDWENPGNLIERKIYDIKAEADKKYRCVPKSVIAGKI